MKTDLTTYGSLLQSQKRLAGAEAKAPVKSETKLPDAPKEKANPDYKLDLSKPLSAPVTPPLPPIPELGVELKKTLPPQKVSEPQVRDGSLKKPSILFVKGMDVFSSPSNSERGYAGVGKMAEAVEGSRIYGWDQHKDIIAEIKKHDRSQPLVLVGHSLGGDTAQEIAEALNTLEHGFRSVDLLITIDAIGFNNDIIPQNVKNHLNVFGEKDLILNDGPHVARRNEMTQVKNILSGLDHTELDDAKDIQFEIVNLIQETLSNKTK